MDFANRYFYITTPIYYVNDAPHIGHAYSTLLADALARYHRLFGEDVHFLTGTDEHGQKVQRAAASLGRDPQQHCDALAPKFCELWSRLSVSHDDFIRTTEQRHTLVVSQVLADLYSRGEIYRGLYSGWYCVPCERFFAQEELREGACPECGRPAGPVEEPCYFLRLSKHQEWLVGYIESHPDFVQPEIRRNETLGFLRKPLADLCVSRPKSRVSWGVELPFDHDYVCYVWIDALINYISAAGYLADPATFDQRWPASCHIIGKDILTTHSVYWPILLHALGLEQPRTILAHGWWLVDGGKIGKSQGNAVDPQSLIHEFGVDAVRYLLLAEAAPGQDTSFSHERLLARYNADLANTLGNLVNRVVRLLGRHFDGAIPCPNETEQVDRELKRRILDLSDRVRESIDCFRVGAAIAEIIAGCRLCNQYLESTAPWKLRGCGPRPRLETVLHTAATALSILSALLYPVIPEKSLSIRRALGLCNVNPTWIDACEWKEHPRLGLVWEEGVLFARKDYAGR